MPESLPDLIGGPSSFVLVLARSAGLVWGLAWLAGASGAGLRSRLAASAVIAVAVAPMVGPQVAPPDDALMLGGSALIEVALGAVLGMGAGLIAGAARLAGEVIGTQAGFSAASSLAPSAGEGMETPLATLSGLIALAAFAALDGPFRLTLALAESYDLGVPLADPSGTEGLLEGAAIRSVFSLISQALGLALWLATPVALSLIVAQVAVGVLARGAPALSSFTAWLPVRLALGLILVLLGLSGLVSGLASAWLAVLPGG